MNGRLSRREFLGRGSAVLVSAGLTAVQPGPMKAAEPIRQLLRGGMLYRRLGRTDLYVSALAFGSHTDPAFKRPAGAGNVLSEAGQARRDRQIGRAFDLGVNMVDTYENEGQWEPVARLVRERRDKVLVSLCRQFPVFVGRNIDQAAKLYGHVDLYRIYVVDGSAVDGRVLEDLGLMR